MNEEIKIITLGDIFENIETEEKAFKFKDYIKGLQQKVEQLEKENNRLNNIINYIWQVFENGSFEDGCDCIEIYDYLKELKENK